MATVTPIERVPHTRWTDRVPRRVLWAVGLEAVPFAALLLWGLAPPSLGTHLAGPALVFALEFAVLAWLTWARPWETTWYGWDGWGTGRWTIWDPGILVFGAASLAVLQHGVLAQAKERLAEMVATSGADPLAALGAARSADAWAADPWGWGLLAGANLVVAVVLPVLVLALVWFFLPRRGG